MTTDPHITFISEEFDNISIPFPPIIHKTWEQIKTVQCIGTIQLTIYDKNITGAHFPLELIHSSLDLWSVDSDLTLKSK